jgi:CheY-like chemotaxis protein
MSLILLVEDEDYLRGVIEEMLKQGGHDVVVTASGKEAVAVCQQRTVDLVITDLAMPGMDGIELIRCLRRSHSRLPVLAMSGTFTGQFFKMAKLMGAVGTIAKPFKQADLLAIIDKSLARPTGS